MTNEQESRFSMYLTVTSFCDANASITANLPNFMGNLATVKSTNTQIQIIGEQQKFDKSGVTKGKNQLKGQLVVLAADAARKLAVYAKFTNNQTLLGEVSYSETEFKRFADTELKDYAQIIYDRTQPIVASLANYGITAASQTALLNAISYYNAALATPRMGTTVKSQATKQLVVLFKTGDATLANMDAAVEIIRLTQVNFYNGYKTARKIVETGIGKLAVKGTVSDSINGEPLKGTTIKFASDNGMAKMKTGNGNGEIVKKTADKGGFNIKTLPEGTYNATISKPGYKDSVVTVDVTGGQLSVVNIKLEKK